MEVESLVVSVSWSQLQLQRRRETCAPAAVAAVLACVPFGRGRARGVHAVARMSSNVSVYVAISPALAVRAAEA